MLAGNVIGHNGVDRLLRSADFEPNEEHKTSMRRRVLEVLRGRGPRGVTRLDAPTDLQLSLAQRVSELRSLGYHIASILEQHQSARIARYVLVMEPSDSQWVEEICSR